MKDSYTRTTKILCRIRNFPEKITKLEDRIEKIADKEIQFQAKVAVLNFYKELNDF